MLLNVFVFQCTFFLLFQTSLPPLLRLLQTASAGRTVNQFSRKNCHEHTGTTSSNWMKWSYQLKAHSSMAGSKPQGAISDPAFLPDPSGSDLLRRLPLGWSYTHFSRQISCPQRKPLFSSPEDCLCRYNLDQGTAISELVLHPSLFASSGKPTKIWPKDKYL